jgi:hypothetical protein
LVDAVEGRAALTESEEDRWLAVLARWMGGGSGSTAG